MFFIVFLFIFNSLSFLSFHFFSFVIMWASSRSIQGRWFFESRTAGAPISMFVASTKGNCSRRSLDRGPRARRSLLSCIHSSVTLRWIGMLSWSQTDLRSNRDQERQPRLHGQASHWSTTRSSPWSHPCCRAYQMRLHG